MNKSKNFTVIFAAALVLVGAIIAVIVVGISIPENPETIQGMAETTDYRVSSKVPARVLRICVRRATTCVVVIPSSSWRHLMWKPNSLRLRLP